MAERRSQRERSSLPQGQLRNIFVGRQRELAELAAALDDALSGQGRLVMLVGEPGIGKTRTAQELAALAEQRGAQVLWGRCYEETGAPPYWPWIQAIRAFVQQAGAEQLTLQMGPGAADIAEIVAEVRDKLPDLETPRALEPGPARFRLFDSITTFLKNAAQSQPIVLVLDDLHWADRSSLLLLEFLAQEIAHSPLLVLGAHRDVELTRGHPLSQTLGALVREQLFRRVQLDGLTRQEVGELVEGSAGITLTPEATEVVHNRTNGNPFFVGEVTRHVTLENITQGRDWANIIPEGVRDAIGRRLNRLSEQCIEALTTASIIGREFDFRLLIILSGNVSENQLLRAVDEAVRAQMIEDVRGRAERFQFSHALIQQTLADELTTTRRVRLHARIAEALEQLYGDDVEVHSAELAHHYVEAQTSTGVAKLVRYSLLAGELALAAYAWDEAIAHFERGLVARDITLSGTEAASDEEAAALLFGLGRARVATTEPLHPLQDALDTLRRAFDYYVDAGNVEHAVAIAEYPYFPRFGYSYGSSQLVARALSLVPSGTHAAGRLLFRYGLILGVEEGDSAGAREAMESAFAIAEREEDTDLEMRILAASARLDRFGLRMEETLRKSQRAIELALRLKDLRTEAAARYEAAIALRNMGDLVESEKHAAAMLDASERLRDRQLLILALNINAGGSRRKGDWRVTREYCLRGLEVSGDGDSRLLSYLAEIAYQVGNIDEGNQRLDQLVEAMRATTPGPTVPYSYPAITIPLVAQITGVPSKFDVAEEAAGIILKGPSANSAVEQAARAGLAFMAVSRGDAEAAGEQYQLLESAPWTLTTVFWVHRGRLLGLLAQTMGNVERAAAHLEEATAFYRKTAHRPDLALTCREYADTLLQQNGPGDREKAMSVMEEALAISRELGMLPLTERIIALQERAESLPAVIPAYPDGLTQREVEVLRLIADGKSNREISEELIITLNTVFRHVSNIFTKIGAANRTEAARYAGQQGLSS